MSTRILKLSAAAAIVVAIPALATAQSVAYSTSPVAVTLCTVNESYEPGLPFGGGPQQLSTSGIALGYVNKSNVPATTVKVSLNDGEFTQNLVATGSFAPGVLIERTFAASQGTNARQNATCSVAEVDFADGSAWHAAPHDVANR